LEGRFRPRDAPIAGLIRSTEAGDGQLMRLPLDLAVDLRGDVERGGPPVKIGREEKLSPVHV
jgi:hypothetical protein